jgi:hypothetical protein
LKGCNKKKYEKNIFKLFYKARSNLQKHKLTAMSSNILVCERSAHPVLMQCLQDTRHDWRPLQLVNKSMFATFRQYAQQVAEYTAKREEYLAQRKKCAELAALCDAAMAKLAIARLVGGIESSVYVLRMFHAETASFDWGHLSADEAGAAGETLVIEVD